MAEYNITKIVDGLFISDSAVPHDSHFLQGNKIIRLLAWTAAHHPNPALDQQMQLLRLSKNLTEVKFPTFSELQSGFLFLEQAGEEMLCGLIYSESELEAALICIMFLMRRFQWDCDTAFAFLRNKMEIFEFSDQAIEELQLYEQQLREAGELRHIEWEYDFLVDYRASNDDEALVVNTIKNKLRKGGSNEQRQKKGRRIRWQDQIRPSSAFAISSSKSIAVRSSLSKCKMTTPINQMVSPTNQQDPAKDMDLLFQSIGFKSANPRKEKRADRENHWEEDVEYLQLKEMSRTNFNDRRYMSSKLKRRGSLKPAKKELQKTQSTPSLQNISAIVGIYSGLRPSSGKGGVGRSSGGVAFLSGLRAFGKGLGVCG